MSSTSKATSRSTEGGLVPGYRRVKEFGAGDEYEDEIEESYATLDLGSVDQTLVPSSSSYRLIGLDSSTPFLQLSGTIMKGHYQTLLGTELIFKDVSEETEFPPHGNIQYFTTIRRITFREIEIKPKTAAPSPPASYKMKFIISGPPTTAEQTAGVMPVDTSASASPIPGLVQDSGENLIQPDTGVHETSQVTDDQLDEILKDEDMYMDE